MTRALTGSFTIANLRTGSAWGSVAAARSASPSRARRRRARAPRARSPERGTIIDGTTMLFPPIHPRRRPRRLLRPRTLAPAALAVTRSSSSRSRTWSARPTARSASAPSGRSSRFATPASRSRPIPSTPRRRGHRSRLAARHRRARRLRLGRARRRAESEAPHQARILDAQPRHVRHRLYCPRRGRTLLRRHCSRGIRAPVQTSSRGLIGWPNENSTQFRSGSSTMQK